MKNTLTYSVDEAGKALGIGRNVAFRLVHQGTIPAIRLGKKLRVPKTAIEEMMRNPPHLKEVV